MTSLVLDASVVGAWYLKGQATAGADILMREAPGLDFGVPHIFPSEVANLLLVAERKGRLAAARSREILDELGGLSLHVYETPDLLRMGSILALARQESLSAYDALYLDLAAREGLPLASRDSALVQAAVRRNVPVRDLRA